jgi:hypothetical protein
VYILSVEFITKSSYTALAKMETWMSWALTLAIAGAAYFYYFHMNNDNAAARGRSTTGKSATSSLKDAVDWTESESKPKAAQKSKAKAPRKSVKTAVQDAGNKASATLAQATSGTEDDSPVASPVAVTNKTPSGKDVSDMLGPQRATSPVMSIKPSEKPARVVKQTQKAEVAQETKKQRQNRKKVEEAKVARDEEEKQRKARLETQLRTAREARGEPAKNGLQQAKAPASNPWTEVPSRGAVQPPKQAPTAQLLDTFEETPAPASQPAASNGKSTKPATYNGLPSEEEQLRLAMEDSAWTTVPKGGKTKRKTVNEEVAEEKDEVTVQKQQPSKPARATEAVKPENTKPTSRYQILAEEFNPKTGDDVDAWEVM